MGSRSRVPRLGSTRSSRGQRSSSPCRCRRSSPGDARLNAMRVGYDDVVVAARRIAPFVRRTPVVDVHGADLGLRGDVFLKLELQQRTGSFKARGAFNALLAGGGDIVEAIAASGGNF